MTTQEDFQRIEAKLDAVLDQLKTSNTRWLTMAETAAHLGISVSTLKRRLAAGAIPKSAIRDTNAGGDRAQLRFDPTQL